MNKKQLPLFVLCLLISFIAVAQDSTRLKMGFWRGTLQLNEKISLPFSFEIIKHKGKIILEVINGEEGLDVDEIVESKDSIKIRMPLFDSEFRCKILDEGKQLQGSWINYNRKEKNQIPFTAIWGKHDQCNDIGRDYRVIQTAKWETTFNPGTPESYKAIGIFKCVGRQLTGTFLTETGDYRYLCGSGCSNNFYLSCFDGSHAFYFSARVKKDSSLEGDFYSGAHGHEKWIAKRNNKFELSNPDSLTYLKKGFDKINFKFRNTEGKEISLMDEKYKGKVVVVQIMGSWCPNCMDETKYLSDIYPKYKTKGLEIIALAFEKTADSVRAKENVLRLKKRFNSEYEFLLTNKTDKDQASAALPMLNAVMAFPTTIYIDRKGRVRKIYTGFRGPGTKNYYEGYKDQNQLFLDQLLDEK